MTNKPTSLTPVRHGSKMRTGLTAIAAGALATATLTTAAGSAHAAPSLAPLLGPSASISSTAGVRVVKDSYIVVLKDVAGLRASAARSTQAGADIGETYTHLFPGYSATLSGTELATVRADPAVKYVQKNLTRHLADEPQLRASRRLAGTTDPDTGSWGIDRIDQRNLPLNDAYYYTATGKGVTIFVLDTGIYAKHPDFGNRVLPGYDGIGSTDGRVDCNSHGTHVAGTAAGKYYGVAKGATLKPVRVLDCGGGGRDDKIIAGMDWIKGAKTGPAVVNMSLGGDFSQTFNDAVQGLIDDGITVTVAAGNAARAGSRGVNACTESPSSVTAALTVAASTIKDKAATFSNYGPCVDLYAPGENITSDIPGTGGQFSIAAFSGTSMASPHVAGVAAMYLQNHRTATPAEVASAINSTATGDKITGVDQQFPHNLLFSVQPVAVPAGVTSGSQLQSGKSLLRGDRLYSSNAAYFLAHRSKDGWLCLYNAASGKVVWSAGHAGSWTTMATNGALGSYDSYGRRTWSSGTSAGASTMTVNGKGYLAISRNSDRKVVWTTPH